MSTLTVPTSLANRIRAKAKAEGVTISDLLNQLLRNHEPMPRTIKRRSLRVVRNDALTRQLNKIYAKEDSSLDPVIAKIQSKALREEW